MRLCGERGDVRVPQVTAGLDARRGGSVDGSEVLAAHLAVGVRRDGARDSADAPGVGGLCLIGRHAVLDLWRVPDALCVGVAVVLWRDDGERGVGEHFAAQHLRLAHLPPIGLGVRRQQLQLARIARRAQGEVVEAACPVAVCMWRRVVPAFVVNDEHEAVQLVPPLQLKVAIELVEVVLHHRRRPLARVVELGALLPVVHGPVFYPIDDDRGPVLVLGLNQAPPTIRACLPAVHGVVLVPHRKHEADHLL
mmetsp:Transcript_14466/g.38445  ORF Transcript_14466/g.38445 Transcript_14466/m.38445 type:complete len:251 (+) Transcript_14466:297-1049(+)